MTLPALHPLPASQRGLSLRSLPHNPSDPAASFRSALAHANTLGAACVSLDCTLPGFRPRELDGSARRELAVLLRRHALSLAGIDCFVPPAHLADASPHQPRAVDALESALALLRDLLSPHATALPHAPFVACGLPGAGVHASVLTHLASTAAAQGLTIADTTHPSCLTSHALAGAASAFEAARFAQADLATTQSTLLALQPLSHVRIPVTLLAPASPSQLDLPTLLALLSTKPATVPILLDAPATKP